MPPLRFGLKLARTGSGKSKLLSEVIHSGWSEDESLLTSLCSVTQA